MFKKTVAFLTALTLMALGTTGCGMGRSGATLEIDMKQSYKLEELTVNGSEVAPVSDVGNGMVVRWTSPKREIKDYLYLYADGSFAQIPLNEELVAPDYTRLPDGRLCAITSVKTGRKNGMDIPDPTHFVEVIYDDALNVVEQKQLGDFPEDCYQRIVLPLRDGSWIVHYSNHAMNGVFIYDDDPESAYIEKDYLYNADFTEKIEITVGTNYVDRYCIGKSGDLYAFGGGTLYRVDKSTGKGEAWLDSLYSLADGGIMSGYADGDYELYYSGGGACYGVKEDGSMVQMMDYLISNIDATVFHIQALPGNRFLGAGCGDSKVMKTCYYIMSPRTEEEIKDINIVSLAGVELDGNLVREVMKYNISQDQSFIAIKDYARALNDQDYNFFMVNGWTYANNQSSDFDALRTQATEQFKSDLLSGVVPDIICLDNLPYQMLSNKGLLTDLQPKLDSDERFDPEKYLMNYLEGLKKGERLERIGFSYTVETTLAKTKWAGEQQGKTPEEYIAMLETLPEDMEIVGWYASRENYTQMFLTEAQSAFIDKGTMTCTFDSESFVKLLELANSVPTLEEQQADQEAYWRRMEGKTFVNDDMFLYSFGMQYPRAYHEAHYDTQIFNHEDVTLVGYPDVQGGNGGRYKMDYTIALSSRSNKCDEVWEFIMNELDTKRQSTLCMESYGGLSALPLHKDSLDNCLKSATIMTTFQSGATEEEMAIIRDYLYHVKNFAENDPTITGIITEEAERYYAGDCTARQAADMIQNRCSLYLSEQK